MGFPASKGHRYDGNLKTGHMQPPTVGAQKVDQPQPPVKGPDVEVSAKRDNWQPETIAKGSQTDIRPSGTEKHPINFMANVNQSDRSEIGNVVPFRTDLPPADQMVDEKGNLKPDIKEEADKASYLSNEPGMIERTARKMALDTKGPDGAVRIPPGVPTEQLQPGDNEKFYNGEDDHGEPIGISSDPGYKSLK